MDFETLVEQFWELAKNNPDGFTFSLELETPTAGYCVAFKATQDSVAILSDKAKAIEAGRKEAQHSIFDLNDLEEIIL